MDFTKSELEVMNVLWRAGRPISSSEILSMSEGKTWRDSYVHLLLNGLIAKKAIIEAGRVRRGRTYGRLYAPKLSYEDYYKNVFSDNRGAAPLLFSAFINSDNVTPELLDELGEMIDRRKQELNQR